MICSIEGCERRSYMPLPYEQLCARHYIDSVKRAEREASARFTAHIVRLMEGRS